MFDHAGRCVREDEIFAGQKVLDLTGLESGRYLLIFPRQTTLVQQLALGANDYTVGVDVVRLGSCGVHKFVDNVL